MDRLGGLVVIAPARRAGDPGSIPGPGENFIYVWMHLYIFKVSFRNVLCSVGYIIFKFFESFSYFVC